MTPTSVWRSDASARTRTTARRSGWQSGTVHRPRTGSEKFRFRSIPDGSCEINPLIQYAQDSRRRAPDVTLRIRHGVIGTLHAAEFLAVNLVVLGIHQERERHLEGVNHFRLVDLQREAGLDPRDRRQDAKSERGSVEIEIADRLDELALEADFLTGLAQRGIERGSVGRIDLAAGKGNLAGVAGEMLRALCQQHGRLRMIDHRDQHRRGPYRLLARDDLEHAVVAFVAGLRNDVGIDQARRHVEIQPRLAAIEELRRTDRSRSHLLQHRLVQSASLTCFASAIAKNSPPDSTPNMG